MDKKRLKIPVQFNKDNLFISKSIVGRGQFAISYMLGRIELENNYSLAPLRQQPSPTRKSPPILIKSATASDGERCFEALEREINILEDLKPHPNILSLIGTCRSENELHLAFEFCGNGNLLKFIRHCNPCSEFEFDSIRSTVTHTESGPVLTITRYRLLQWSYEICSGMKYLAANKVNHNDLSARNVLVTFQWNMKICNFALSQKTQENKPPHSLPMDVLGIKWMAPEVIKDLEYSEKNDVWAFGVTMWEICSLGEVPYRDWVVDNDFWKLLNRSQRLEKPRFSTADMWKVMNSCWNYLPEDRPKFSTLTKTLKKLISMKDSHGQNRAMNMHHLRQHL